MKKFTVAMVVLLVGLPGVVWAERPGRARGKALAALEKKMVGAWEGQTGCAGNFLFRADGTYELRGYGPGGDDSLGTWKIGWDALPPTLLLTCKSSEFSDDVGKTTEWKLIQLDDENLAVQYAKQTVNRYARVKK